MAKVAFYITLLEYIRDKNALGESVNYNETKAYVQDIHSEVSDEAFLRVFFNNLGEALSDYGHGHSVQIERNTPFVLTKDAYFQLLEHQELQEARQSSRRAHYTAIFAIGISIAVGAWQIVKTPTVELDKSQFSQLKEAIEKSK